MIRVNRQLIQPAHRFAIMREVFQVLREDGGVGVESLREAAFNFPAKRWAGLTPMPE